ncbi:folylpolyglutamate synthase/dihydrofolate synthase family protein [Solibacillus sp. CAU 1738]|uniref:bifunctional folylpolyglutamate synthase/dihydrofolate synthase n=1 Tax=Solibacillus sp. CAU 1738 TaxID=3140363 RepID=UPI0032615B0A
MIPKFDVYKERWQLKSDDMIKPGLDSMKQALKLLGHPEQHLAVVHLAGTNGKGSTLTFLEQVTRAHGLSVGKFMSPCIVDVHDQIQVNGEPIMKQELDYVFQQMVEANLSSLLTDFELLTCAAILHFNNTQVDVVLLEAGMGGREDSTNVVTPIVSIIPSIALEHTNFLGDTLTSIAGHKAGIIKNGKPVVTGVLQEEACKVVKHEAFTKKAPLLMLGDIFEVKEKEGETIYSNDEMGIVIDGLYRQLQGPHQGQNMALAITSFFEVAEALRIPIDFDAIRLGVRRAKVPGRFEEILPNLYFDGAHNPASAEMLVQTIRGIFPNQKVEFIIGMLADKDVQGVLYILSSVAKKFTFVDFDNPRAIKAEKMLNMSNGVECVVKKIDEINFRKENEGSGIRIVTGSLYLISELRNLIKL